MWHVCQESFVSLAHWLPYYVHVIVGGTRNAARYFPPIRFDTKSQRSKQSQLQWAWYLFCGSACSLLAVVEGICYVVLYVRFRKQPGSQGSDSAQKKRREAEVKLIWLGVVLFLIQAVCGAFCISMAFARTEIERQVTQGRTRNRRIPFF